MKFFISFCFVLVLSMSSVAQIGGSISATDSRSAAMGNAATANSRGIFSVGKNPANLSFNEDGRIEIYTNLLPLPLPSLSFGVGTNFMSISDLNYFFGGVPDPADPSKKIGRYLTVDDKQKFVDLFSDGGKVFTSFTMPWFSFYYNAGDKVGAFAFSINENFALDMNVPQGLAKFAMNGNATDSVVSFSDMSMKTWWLRDYSLSYSRDISDLLTNTFKVPENLFKRLTFGISFKYVQGFAYVGSETFDANITTTEDQISFNSNSTGLSAFSPDLGVKYEFDQSTYGKEAKASPLLTSAGKGFGIDFGFSAQMNDALTLAFAFTNLGSVKWNTNAARFTYDNSIVLNSLTEKSETDTAKERVKRYKGEYISEFSTSLPGVFRFGAAYQLDKAPFIGDAFPGTMLLTFDFIQGLNEMPGNSKKPRVAFGTEWKPMNWIPFIRTGVSFGGVDKFNWTLGLGFNGGIFDFGIGTKDFHQLLSNNLKRGSIAFDTRWKF